MPRALSSAAHIPRDGTGSLPFKDMLSQERFFIRARSVKRQMTNLVRNPLFMELSAQRGPFYEPKKRKLALAWRRLEAGGTIPAEPLEATSASTSLEGDVVMAHGGSSIGNVRRLCMMVCSYADWRA